MSDIHVYNSDGEIVNTIYIPDKIKYVNGRVCIGEKFYYKGIGVPYKSHFVLDENLNQKYKVLSKSDVFYLGSEVIKECFSGKFGIFQERYQNHFTDWIGACGVKEINILENLYDENKFERSSIDVLGYETIDEENQQYYLKVRYDCERKSFLDYLKLNKLRDLIDYMVQSNWNFPWDKDSITDISWDGRVTDVADVFYSEELMHQIGTVYSILYSLGTYNYDAYLNFCKLNQLTHEHQMFYVLNTLKLLQINGVDISPVIKSDLINTYKNVVKNYLILGKNCGFCGVGSCLKRKDANFSYGEEIRQGYIERVSKMI